MKMYSLKACENLISEYIDRGGQSVTIEDGILGLGLTVCFGEGLKISVIQEVYLNEWSSGHKVRMYNKMPKKYENMIAESGY